MHRILITALFLFVATGVVNAQNSIDGILQQVEANNLTLHAKASLTEADMLAEKVGNSLPDPELEYGHVWGTPSSLGKQGEFSAKQSFDFPTAYAARNKLAKLRGRQYTSEYERYRQQILLETHTLCIEIISLRRQRGFLDMRSGFAHKLAEVSGKMLEAGEINVLQAAEARIQYLAANNATKLLDVAIAASMGRLKILNGGIEVEFPDTEFPGMTTLMPFDEMAGVYYQSDPTLSGALAERDAAKQEVKASRSESLPKFALGYKLEHGNGEQFHGLVAGVSIPMFGNRNNVKRAKARERYAALQADDAHMAVEQQLTTLYAKIAILEESIRNYEEITEDTDEYLENMGKALEVGQISITDYFSQYDAIVVFEEALIGLIKEYHLVRARIYSVML